MNRIKAAEYLCFLLVIINVATAGVDLYFRRAAAASVPFPPGQLVSGSTGITVSGSPPATGASCRLVRYASLNCGYCSPQYSQAWNELERTLTKKGCEAIIVSPYATDLPLGDGITPEQRLAGVSVQFMESTHFNSTPITLLVDRDWKIVWSHVGVLDGNDYQQALSAAGF